MMGETIARTFVYFNVAVAVCVIHFTVAAQEPAADSLVAAYAFDEGVGGVASDSSGNSLTGMITGASWSVSGHSGKALSFDGSGDYVSITNVAPLNLTTGLSLQAWVYPTALSGWRTVMLKERQGTSSGLSYAIYANDNSPRPASYIRVGTSDVSAIGGAQLPLNSWTHLAATYDNSMLRLYTNGVLAGSQAATGNIVNSSNPLRIGGNTIWGEYFTGLIDDVRIHRRALAQSEIQALMALPVSAEPGFEFILYDDTLTLGLSDSGFFNLGIAPTGGFTSWVYPMVAGLPPDTTAVFEPLGGPPHPGPFALTITTGPTTPGGIYSLSLTGTNGPLSAATNITLIVNTNPDFHINVEPNGLVIPQGQTGVANCELLPENGYSQTVTFGVTGLPAGVSVEFQPPSLTPPGSSSVQFNIGPAVTPGTYNIQIKGHDGTLTNNAAFALTVLAASGDGFWRQLTAGDSGAKYYGVIVGDVGDTGTNRVYGSGGDGLMYEYKHQGSNWFFNQMPVGVFADGEMHNMAIGPARRDGTNRLYIAAVNTGRLYEMTWINGAWTTNVVAILTGITDVVIGDGRNDGVTRMYVCWMSGTTEFTRNGSSWSTVTMSSNEGGWVHGIDLGNGRNDGTNRIYTANQGDGGVYEYSWNGAAWTKLFMGNTGDARNIEIGNGRNDGTNRAYVGAGAGNVYEFTWNGAAWQNVSIGNGGTTSVKVQAIPVSARSDGLVRVYAAAGSGVYEYAWSGSAWEAQHLGSAVAYMYGLAYGDGLNNGRLQIYASSYDGNVYIFEWVSTVATVPNVLGYSQSFAAAAITNANLTLGSVTMVVSDGVPWGNVISQSPAGGTELAPGSAVNLTVSIGPPPALEVMPADWQLLLMWPTSSLGFELWFSTNLAAPDWTIVSPPPAVVGGSYVVTNQPGAQAGFYRLKFQ